jgi:hypothetical protein
VGEEEEEEGGFGTMAALRVYITSLTAVLGGYSRSTHITTAQQS